MSHNDLVVQKTSRVGRKPVLIPTGVKVSFDADRVMTVAGPKGTLHAPIHEFVDVVISDTEIMFSPNAAAVANCRGAATRLYRAIVGTVRANVANMLTGVHLGFEKKLQLVGVGYRAQLQNAVLSLSLGFSHPITFAIPEGITIETPTQTEILIKGNSKELVGLAAAQIRKIRAPEPYKGKGVRYADEKIILKETKKK